ncbi:retrovirus-related pol polyprotein from transposon TNT 1-94 [Tanacetum coccineum]
MTLLHDINEISFVVKLMWSWSFSLFLVVGEGISQNFSSPYTLEQNGVAERKNITLIEVARTMLNESVISKHFWTEAVRIAYILLSQKLPESLTQEDNKLRRLNTLEDEIGIDDSSKYPPDEFIHEDDPSRKYQTDFDISYYVIPRGPPDLIKTKRTHEQNVQNEQTITQPTEQVKQVWKATGKLFTTIGHQWRPTGRLLPLGDQWPLTRNTPPKVLPTKQWKPTGRLLPLGRQCPLVRSTALKSDCLPADPQETIAPVVQIVLWYLDSGCSKHMTGDRSRLRNFVKKFIGTVRFGNDHFGAIMGYGDYVIGDSVISRNRTLVEAARTMLIFSKALMFLWSEAVATACYTQNRSLIHTLHNKTPYELVHDKKPDLSFLRVFGALCYPTNDSEDLGKLKAKADIGFFVGYAPNKKGY